MDARARHVPGAATVIALLLAPALSEASAEDAGEACVFCGCVGPCLPWCASFDPPMGKKPCPSCGMVRHLFRDRATGVVACWSCRGEPDPGEPDAGEPVEGT